jgi:tetratricopeptide (TPR) repeat protein
MAVKTHFSPAYLSEVETEQKPVTSAVLDAYRQVLGADTTLDVDRLAATIADPSSVGSSALEDISVILERTRHLEDTVGSTLVIPTIRGIDTMTRALVPAGGAELAAEVATYRGHLERAGGRHALAGKLLSDAAVLSYGVDDSLYAHALAYTAHNAWQAGDLRRALGESEAASQVSGAHPTVAAYVLYLRADLLAAAGDDTRSFRTLHRADKIVESLSGEPPAENYFYTPGYFAVHRGVVLSALGRQSEAVREAQQGLEALPPELRRAQWLTEGYLGLIDPDMTADA